MLLNVCMQSFHLTKRSALIFQQHRIEKGLMACAYRKRHDQSLHILCVWRKLNYNQSVVKLRQANVAFANTKILRGNRLVLLFTYGMSLAFFMTYLVLRRMPLGTL